MDDITSQSVVSLADLIKTRRVSPIEVVEAYLGRIEILNPVLNAIVTIAPDLMERAREAEAAVMRNSTLGLLHGIPMTIKDTIETAGLRTTSGSSLRSKFVPAKDAPSVARLKEAGAIILGKTNPAEMAMDYTADNPVFGPTNNPHDFTRTPGGSSGGEAAAIAACLSPCGLGSDLAGSIRIPSHFCGIAGLKPGTDRVPGEGQMPPNTGPYSLGAAIGPMARNVEDLYLLFKVLAGGGQPASALTQESWDNTRTQLIGRRVAWYTDDGVPVTKETRQAVAAAAHALSGAGLIVEEQCPPGVELGHELWLKLFSRASVVQLRDLYTGHEQQAGSFVRWRLATADESPPCTLDEYIRFWMERDAVSAKLVEWMNNIPLLLAPVGATPAVEHGAHKVTVAGKTISVFRAFSYSQTFNVFDLPSVCVPAGFSGEELPIGIQVVGPPFSEESVLAVASIVEAALGGWRPPAMSGRP